LTRRVPCGPRFCGAADDLTWLSELLANSKERDNERVCKRSLMAVPFAFPSLDEQRSIAHRVHAALNRIDRLASETFSARKLIDQLDQVILVNAFQGRRSVQGAVLPMMLCTSPQFTSSRTLDRRHRRDRAR
jgi:hypothetical protein